MGGEVEVGTSNYFKIVSHNLTFEMELTETGQPYSSL